jgi:methylglutaconyl-CoA hydratase
VSAPETKVDLELNGAVASVTLRRPEVRNAFDEQVLAGLEHAFEQCAASETIRVVVLSGDGPAFCAGADIGWMRREGARSARDNAITAQRMAELFERIDSLPLPVIVRAQGAALGGGLGLVAVGDIVIVSRDCKFSLPEVRLGILPAVVAPYVVAKIGTARARDLFLTGRRFGGVEAESWGLATRVVDEEELDAEVDRATRQLLAGGAEAITRAKRLIRGIDGRRAADVHGFTASEIAAARSSAEGQEGLSAFLEKRRASWIEEPPLSANADERDDHGAS